MGGLEVVEGFLREQSTDYVLREHAKAYTTQEIAALEHVAGRRVAKVVMVWVGQELVMLVLPASRHVSLSRLTTEFPGHEVRIAHEEEFVPAFPDCDPGAMSPFGNLYGVKVCVDMALAEDENIVFQAGTHRHTIEVAYSDFERLARPTVMSLSDPTPAQEVGS